VDVVPTILDALAQDPAEHLVEGRSLLPLTRAAGAERESAGQLGTGIRSRSAAGAERESDGPTIPWRDAAFSELDWTFRGARRRLDERTGHHHAWMVRTDRWKYVHWTSGYRPQLFDLAADPEEFHDLGADPAHEAVRERLRERLLAWFTGLKRRTTLTWAEAELRTDSYKKAGVFFGEW
jgi:arylsulfatase A-like enzyme